MRRRKPKDRQRAESQAQEGKSGDRPRVILSQIKMSECLESQSLNTTNGNHWCLDWNSCKCGVMGKNVYE